MTHDMSQHRIASLSALLAAFPSENEQTLAKIREAWRLAPQELRAFAEQHAPKTMTWVRACFNSPTTGEVRRHVCDELLGTHGVEFLGVHRRSGQAVYYCNAGDTYACTLIFHGTRAYLGCWGDLIERRAVRERS